MLRRLSYGMGAHCGGDMASPTQYIVTIWAEIQSRGMGVVVLLQLQLQGQAVKQSGGKRARQ